MSLTSQVLSGQSTQLKSLRFRQERELEWSELERLVNTYERDGVKALSDDEILAAPVLYRSTLSALSVARSTSLDKALVDYLEALCTRGYYFIYGSRATLWDKVKSFFRVEWPAAVRAVWKETAVSALVMFLGVVVAMVLFSQSNEWYFTFVPSELSGGRDPGASTEFLREGLYDGGDAEKDGLSVFATYLFSHNSRVALMAFALGFAFAIPSAFVIGSNGMMLGMFIGLYASRGLGFELGGWLIIHGTTEIFAFVLAGAGGLNLGRAMAFPGDQSRLKALAQAGVTSGTVLAGCVVMLFFAGLLEGFGRQLIVSDLARYSVGITAGILWCLYFYGPRRSVVGAVS